MKLRPQYSMAEECHDLTLWHCESVVWLVQVGACGRQGDGPEVSGKEDLLHQDPVVLRCRLDLAIHVQVLVD